MITTQNIYTAIKRRLGMDFPNIANQIKDLKNPDKPCFYIEYVESHDRVVANGTTQTTCSFNIVYYSQAKTLLDLTAVEKALRKSLKKPLKVSYQTESGENSVKFLDILDAEFEPDEYEYVLECSIGFDFMQNTEVQNPYDEYENSEVMEELDINVKENEV